MKQFLKKSLGIVLLTGFLLSPVIAFAETTSATATNTATATATATSATAATSTVTAAATKTQTVLGEVSTFGELISLIWNYGSQVIIALAVFFIILGALFYITSAGNEDRISQGKQMIIGSLIAIIMVISSGVLIKTLHKPVQGSSGYLTDVPNVINNASNILIGFVGVFTVLMFIYAGINYMLAAGDADKIEKAHRSLKYAIYGLIIGVLAYGIVNAVINYLI